MSVVFTTMEHYHIISVTNADGSAASGTVTCLMQ